MSVFSWENLAGNLQENALEDKGYKKEVDERFWTLSRDENENGGALIRFLPDKNLISFIKMSRISANRGKKQFFVDEWSPESIGLPDPFRERFWELWNKGEKEKAKQFGRKERYIANILVQKDPANPENDGKVFLFDMSKTLFDKVKAAMVQTEAMKALDEKPIAVFDPIEGESFLLKAKKGATGIITYDDSKFAGKVTSLFKTEEEALKFIKENCYELNEFLVPEFFKSYDELLDLRDKFAKEGKYAVDANKDLEKAVENVEVEISQETQEVKAEPKEEAKAEPKAEPKEEAKTEPEPKKEESIDSELDDLLADLG